MLIKIYELITKLQDQIGNGVEISLRVKHGVLEIRADWWGEDLHTAHQFAEADLAQVKNDNSPIDFIVDQRKKDYAQAKGILEIDDRRSSPN